MSIKKKKKTCKNYSVEVWTEAQYEEYLEELYRFDYIAGFTPDGVPYGIRKGELIEEDKEIELL